MIVGCMHLGGAWDDSPHTPEDEQRHHTLIETALELELHRFDHADIYCRGKSETLFGRWLADAPSRRDDVHLTSKCGIRFADTPTPGIPGRYDFSYEWIVEAVEHSLRRLHTDHLDTLLLHRPDPLGEPEEVARAFDTLHQSGKVRCFGVSNHSPAQIRLLQRATDHTLVANQVECSLVHPWLVDTGVQVNRDDGAWTHSEGLLDFCRQEHIQVQAWSPLAQGKVCGGTGALPEAVHRIAAHRQEPAEAVAMAWLMRHPAGIVPVTGTTRPERLKAAARAREIRLSREEWYALLAASRGRPVP